MCSAVCSWVCSATSEKKVLKNKKTQHLALCLLDLLDDGEESDIDESEDWIQLIDRGGLTNVNDVTYHLFVAMELEIRNSHNLHRM